MHIFLFHQNKTIVKGYYVLSITVRASLIYIIYHANVRYRLDQSFLHRIILSKNKTTIQRKFIQSLNNL